MSKWKEGDTVRMKGGGKARILAQIGSGGQGDVYRVSYNDAEYALKWYHEGIFGDREKDFYRNLENNIQNGAPTEDFLWPLVLSEKQNHSFGYLMGLRPEGYEELTRFFVGSQKKEQVKFQSFQALFSAAIRIIQAFRELHSRGYSYQDINDGNFFINPKAGKVLICDNENVSPFGTNLGVLGKQRWMAPEIVTGQCDPDKESDRFSLSVVLFRMLFINHPLEGRYSTPPCMTKEYERKYYGTDPIFIYDPTDSQNRPVPGTDFNLKRLWPLYPDYIHDLFIRAFSQDVLKRRSPRVLEREWLNAFFRLRAETGPCPGCGEEMFYTPGKESTCFECGTKVPGTAVLELPSFTLPVFKGQKVYLWQADSSREDTVSVLGEIIANPKKPDMLGLVNESQHSFTVHVPEGVSCPLLPGQVVPIQEGYRVDFFGDGKSTALMREAPPVMKGRSGGRSAGRRKKKAAI